jgi:hypothetical protein
MSGRPHRTYKPIEKLLKTFCAFFVPMINGKSVELNITECKDSALSNRIVPGKIHGVCEVVMVASTESTISDEPRKCALVKLESPIMVDGHAHDRLAAIPRHRNYGFCRFLLSWIAVYVIPANFPPDPTEVVWEDVVGIGTLKLKR